MLKNDPSILQRLPSLAFQREVVVFYEQSKNVASHFPSSEWKIRQMHFELDIMGGGGDVIG